MNKKYEIPELEIQYFNVIDRLTMDAGNDFSQIVDDPDFGWEEW